MEEMTMAKRSFLPSLRRRGELVRREEEYPYYSLQREMNRLFDDFFHGFEMEPFSELEARFSGFSPSIDVREDDENFTVRVEIPGIDEKDVEVQVTEDAVIIKGEKKEEQEDKGKDYCCMERTYGSFHRTIRLPSTVNREAVDASFKNGVLTVTLPKIGEPETKAKKIPIKAE